MTWFHVFGFWHGHGLLWWSSDFWYARMQIKHMIDWSCFYYFMRKSPVALLEALFAQFVHKENPCMYAYICYIDTHTRAVFMPVADILLGCKCPPTHVHVSIYIFHMYSYKSICITYRQMKRRGVPTDSHNQVRLHTCMYLYKYMRMERDRWINRWIHT